MGAHAVRFLAGKERRSGSLRTVQSYSRMLHHFFGRAGKAPDEVTSQDVFACAYGTGVSGKQPGSITSGARLACLSSFYRFLIRMKVVSSNPRDALERPKVTAGAARGLSGEQIHRLLDLVPTWRTFGAGAKATSRTLCRGREKKLIEVIRPPSKAAAQFRRPATGESRN